MKHRVKKGATIFLLLGVQGVLGFSFWVWAMGLARVTPQALKGLIERKDLRIVIVDTRSKDAYESAHIPGAVNLPWEMDLKDHGQLPRNKKLILYCDCAQEETAADVGRQLAEKWGYKEINVLSGGWQRWTRLGYPLERNGEALGEKNPQSSE